MDKKKILIADDEHSVRLLVKRLLSQNYIVLNKQFTMILPNGLE